MSHSGKQNRAPAPSAVPLALLLIAGLAGCGGGNEASAPLPPPQPQILSQSLPDGSLGIDYDVTVVVGSGTPPFTWQVAAGSLPDGLKLNSSSANITGIPTTVGTFMFKIRVTDSLEQRDSRDFTVRIGVAGNPQVERISVASDGREGNSDSGSPAVSDAGRFIAFTSFATNLVPNDANNATDVFLRDRTCGVTIRVSVATDGSEGNSNSFAPALSSLTAGTLFVAYVSDANNLVANDTNNARDIFVTAVDTTTCPPVAVSTARVSVAQDGTEGNGESTFPTISADGTVVAYQSRADNLAGSEINQVADIFVTEIQFAGGVVSPLRTQLMSTVPGAMAVLPRTTADIFSATTIGNSTLGLTPGAHVGQQAEIVEGLGAGQTRTITANTATTLSVDPPWDTVPDDTSIFRILSFADQTADIFTDTTIGRSDLTMTDNEHVNRLVEIVAGAGASQIRKIVSNTDTTFTLDPAWSTIPDATSVFRLRLQGSADSFRARISADAAFVAFHSLSRLDVDDINLSPDVFVRERATGITRRVSINTAGESSNGSSNVSALNGDGSFVLFHSTADNLVMDDTNRAADLFVRDRVTPETTRVTLASDGSEASPCIDINNIPQPCADVTAGLSGGSRLVAFSSFATNLVPDDRNVRSDIFLHDRQTGQTVRLSLGLDGINPNSDSFDAAISFDGTTVAFASAATNLVLNDTNQARDVFVVDTGFPPGQALIVASGLPAPRRGLPYAGRLRAVGGKKPLFWTVSKGALPPGLFLDPSTGWIRGLPQRAGRFRFTVLVIDAARPARTSRKTLTLRVRR
ncbi:MAG: putative Ig domain-containing protein [Terriglobia bacterium]